MSPNLLAESSGKDPRAGQQLRLASLAPRFDEDRHQVAVQEATATGARTARVSIVARVRPAATAWVLAAWSDGVVIEATSSATAD